MATRRRKPICTSEAPSQHPPAQSRAQPHENLDIARPTLRVLRHSTRPRSLHRGAEQHNRMSRYLSSPRRSTLRPVAVWWEKRMPVMWRACRPKVVASPGQSIGWPPGWPGHTTSRSERPQNTEKSRVLLRHSCLFARVCVIRPGAARRKPPAVEARLCELVDALRSPSPRPWPP